MQHWALCRALIVLGPLGAVAGAVVGYTAGPAIASSWGLRRSSKHYQRHNPQSAGGPVKPDERAARKA